MEKGWGDQRLDLHHVGSYLLISTCVFSKDDSFNQQEQTWGQGLAYALFPERISELLLKGVQGELLSHLVWFASWSLLGMSQN